MTVVTVDLPATRLCTALGETGVTAVYVEQGCEALIQLKEKQRK